MRFDVVRRPLRLTALLAVAATCAGVLSAVAAGPAAASTTGGVYAPLTQTRILDTRSGFGAPRAHVGPHATLHLQVAGRGGVPLSGAGAVVLTLTVPTPGRHGYLTAYATGTSRPGTASLNFVPRVATAVSAVVALGAGWVDIYNGSDGSIQIIADVSGYYTAGAAASPGTYGPVTPTRLVDTRTGLGASRAPVPAHGTLHLQIAGRGGIPSAAADSVTLTLTAVTPAWYGYLSAYADRSGRPGTSNLNFQMGNTGSNLAVVKMSPSGRIAVYNGSNGAVQVVVDVAGYHLAGVATAAGEYESVTPTRILDTRYGIGTTTEVVAPGQRLTFSVAGRGAVPAYGVGAAVLNITATDETAGGHLQLSEGSSFLNFGAQVDRADLVVAKLAGDGTVSVWNVSGASIQLVAEVAGYYFTAPSIAGLSVPSGSMSGGQQLTVSGIGFTPQSEVTFDEVAATVTTVDGPGSLTVTVPAHDPGPVDVRVRTTYGTSPVVAADGFYYFGPDHALSWSPESTIDPPRGAVKSVSCPTTDYCAALDAYGDVTTFDGTGWSTPAAIEVLGGGGYAISCPSPGTCLATGGSSTSLFAVLKNGVWRSAAAPSGSGGVLTCLSATFCVSGPKGANWLSVFDGSNWTTSSFPFSIEDISCATSSFCVAVGAGGNVITYDGTSWTAPSSLGADYLISVSCTSATFCVAAAWTNFGMTAVHLFNGTAWTAARIVDDEYPIAMSCASAAFCMIVDGFGRAVGYDGNAWSAPGLIPRDSPDGYVDVSCPATDSCVAVSLTAAAAYSQGAWTTSLVDPFRGQLASVSCTPSRFCAAADRFDNLTTTDGATWTPLTDSGVRARGPNSVSCVSSSFCVLVDEQGAALYDGAGWQRLPDPGLSGESSVSCSTTTHCVAVDGTGRSASFDGSAWTVPKLIRSVPPLTPSQPSVSCPTDSFCSVLFPDGVLYMLTGNTWTQSTLQLAHATEVSCTSTAFCIAVAANATFSHYDGATWSTPVTLGYNATHLSCTSARHCVLTGAASFVWDGSAWSGPDPVPTRASGPISCASKTFCVALTSNGVRTVTEP